VIYPIKPVEMSIAQIEEIRDLFIRCAIWAYDAGCNGVELHAAHGYLINQFMSPHTNRRKDRYGGSLKKRLRFVCEIATEIRKNCGEDFIIGMKMSAHEHLKNGINTDIAIDTAKMIEAQGILNYLHISAFTTLIPGFLDCDYPSVPPIYTPNPLVPLAEAIKKEVDLPIIATGGIYDPEYANNIIKKGKTDMVALARALIADPEWSNKAKNGKNIKYCILCNTCYFRGMQQKSIKCSVNPYVSEERRYSFYLNNKSDNPKNILIVGAGPGGMEAALTAKKRGHKVMLIEKDMEEGGLLKLASIPKFKTNLSKLLGYYQRELKENNINTAFGIEINDKNVLNYDFEILIMAVGGKLIKPEIKGIEKSIVTGVNQALLNKDFVSGNKVLVIGAGLVGLETSLHFALSGKNVSILDIIGYDEILTD
jgi:NADPH-dependent 2,4-dienoyl-CoA reductase/sulfur reductase-like enzyme